jgi:hypothetical protein
MMVKGCWRLVGELWPLAVLGGCWVLMFLCWAMGGGG